MLSSNEIFILALTETKPLPLGYQAPDFELTEPLTGKKISLADVRGEHMTVVAFICNHCPYVIHMRAHFTNLAKQYLKKGVGFVAISANDVDRYPADSPENMAAMARELGLPFPYLYDESQQVAKSYDAACTPDFSVFDHALRCVYRGRYDASTPGNGIPLTGSDLKACLNAVLKGKSLQFDPQPSIGCGIKWK